MAGRLAAIIPQMIKTDPAIIEKFLNINISFESFALTIKQKEKIHSASIIVPSETLIRAPQPTRQITITDL